MRFKHGQATWGEMGDFEERVIELDEAGSSISLFHCPRVPVMTDISIIESRQFIKKLCRATGFL